MPISKFSPVWHDRISQIVPEYDDIRFPGNGELTQDREWCEVTLKSGATRRIRFHDYHELYAVPGLYEAVFYERLQCSSPTRVVSLLEDLLSDLGDHDPLRVLDVGAGNGMVGDQLAAVLDTEKLVGIDIIPEAKDATKRDRDGLYDDYLVTDLTDLPEDHERRLRSHRFNCLLTVAALGFGDIPPKAFAKALDMISVPGWLAFNIKEDFLSERNSSGFSELIRELSRREIIQIQSYRRYCHRLSVSEKPLHYVAMVARKLQELPDEMLEFTGSGRYESDAG